MECDPLEITTAKNKLLPLLSKTIQNLLFTVFETKPLGRIKRSSGLRLSVIVLSNFPIRAVPAVVPQG